MTVYVHVEEVFNVLDEASFLSSFVRFAYGSDPISCIVHFWETWNSNLRDSIRGNAGIHYVSCNIRANKTVNINNISSASMEWIPFRKDDVSIQRSYLCAERARNTPRRCRLRQRWPVEGDSKWNFWRLMFGHGSWMRSIRRRTVWFSRDISFCGLLSCVLTRPDSNASFPTFSGILARQ